jgi:hypothetical protein
MEKHHESEPNVKHVSLNAAGMMAVYHFGVCASLQESNLLDNVQFWGASSGAVVAAAVLGGKSAFSSAEEFVRVAPIVAGDALEMLPCLEEGIARLCPVDGAKRCSGRLRIGASRLLPRLRGIIPTLLPCEYRSNFVLKESLRASAHIPST